MWPLDDSCGSAFHSLRETVRLPASSLALLVTLNSFWPTQSPPGLGGRRVVTKPLNGTEAGSGRSASQWRGIRHSPPPATKIPEEPPLFISNSFWPTQSPPGLGGRRVVTKPLNGTEAGSGRSASQWRGIRHSPPPATKIPEEPNLFTRSGDILVRHHLTPCFLLTLVPLRLGALAHVRIARLLASRYELAVRMGPRWFRRT